MSDIKFTIDDASLQAALKANQERQEALNAAVLKYGPAASKAYNQAEAAAKRAEAATKRAAAGPSAWTVALQANTKAMGDLRGQINLGAESLGKLGGAVSLISPELATLTGGLQKVTGLFSAGASSAQLLGAGLTTAATVAGAVAVALSPLILLWRDHSAAVEASAAATKLWNDVQDDGASLIARSKNAIAELAIETASLTDAQRAEQRLALDWQKARDAANAGIDEQIRLVEAQIGQSAELDAINRKRVALGEEELAVIRKTSPEYEAQTLLLKRLRSEKKANTTAMEDGLRSDRQLVALRIQNADVDRQLAQAERDLEEAKRKGIAATKDAGTAERERAQAQKEESDFIAGVHAEIDALKDLYVVEEDLTALYGERKAAAEAAGAARETQILRDLELTERLTSEQQVKHQQAANGIADAYAMASDAIGDHLDSVMDDRLDKITDLEEAIEAANAKGQTARAKGLTQQLAKEKAAAQKTFEQQQTLSAANATVSWLEALVKATTYGPIGGPIVAAAATAAYGFSLKAIESEKPEFTDTPGPVRLTPNNRDVGGARGAANDSAVFYRDPNMGIAQIVGEAVRRSMPAPAQQSSVAFGLSLGSIGVHRLLTDDALRANRNQLTRRRA